VAGMIIAPPAPSSARARISTCALCANAASADATPNSAYPSSSTRRRPTLSPSVPNRISRDAQTSGYVSTIHSSSIDPGLRSSVTAGTATCSTVASTATSSRLTHRTTRTIHRWAPA